MINVVSDKQAILQKELFEKHLAFLQSITFRYERLLLGEQNSLKRFLYCATEKLNKSCAALIRLYPAIYEDQDIEFAMGVILRSLLMDSILTQYLRRATLTLEDSGNNYAEIGATLQKESLKLIADGTVSIFEDFIAASTIVLEQDFQVFAMGGSGIRRAQVQGRAVKVLFCLALDIFGPTAGDIGIVCGGFVDVSPVNIGSVALLFDQFIQ